MSQRVYNNRDYLSVLTRCSPQVRKSIVKQAPHELVKSIAECCLNIKNGNVLLKNKKNKKKILSSANRVFKVLNAKTSLMKKRQFLSKQRGGFFSVSYTRGGGGAGRFCRKGYSE